MYRRPRRSTLSPYTTLSRSAVRVAGHRINAGFLHGGLEDAGDVRPALPLDILGNSVLRLITGRPGKGPIDPRRRQDRKSTRLNSSHANISYAVFCLKK